MLRALSMVGATILFVGTAAAQPPAEPTITLEAEAWNPPALVVPEQEKVEGSFALSWTCSQPEWAAPQDVYRVSFRVLNRPSSMEVTLSPVELWTPSFDTATCMDDDAMHRIQGDVVMAISRDALAFEPVGFDVEAHLELVANDTNPRPVGPRDWGPFTVRFEVVPDFVASVQVLPDRILQVTPSGTNATFPITVINFANGPSRVSFDIVPRGEPGRVNIVPPPPIVFHTTGEASGVVTGVHVLAPRVGPGGSRMVSFDLVATQESFPVEAESTMVINVPLSLKVTGAGYGAAPTSSAALVACLVLGLVWGVRGRR